jgi:hypothetical protein
MFSIHVILTTKYIHKQATSLPVMKIHKDSLSYFDVQLLDLLKMCHDYDDSSYFELGQHTFTLPSFHLSPHLFDHDCDLWKKFMREEMVVRHSIK